MRTKPLGRRTKLWGKALHEQVRTCTKKSNLGKSTWCMYKITICLSFCSFGWQRLTSRAGEASWDNVEDVCSHWAIRYNLQTTPVVVGLIPTGATYTCSRPRYKCHSLVVEGPGLTIILFNPCRCRSDLNAATSWRVWRCCAKHGQQNGHYAATFQCQRKIWRCLTTVWGRIKSSRNDL